MADEALVTMWGKASYDRVEGFLGPVVKAYYTEVREKRDAVRMKHLTKEEQEEANRKRRADERKPGLFKRQQETENIKKGFWGT